MRAGLQVQIVGCGVPRRHSLDTRGLGGRQLYLQRLRHVLRDLTFHVENVVQCACVGFRPEMLPLFASINCTLISTWLPAFCTVPSSSVATPSCRAMVFTSSGWLGYFSVEVRAITLSPPIPTNWVRIMSCMPLAKYALFCSVLRLSNGSTAMDLRSTAGTVSAG